MSQLSSAITPDALQSIGTASGNLNAAADRELAYAQLQAQKEQAEAELRAKFALQEGQIAAEAAQQKAQADLAKELQSGESQRYREYQDFQARQQESQQGFQAQQQQRGQQFEADEQEKNRQQEQTMFDEHRQAAMEEQLSELQALSTNQEAQAELGKRTIELAKKRGDLSSKLAAAQVIYENQGKDLQKALINLDSMKQPLIDSKKQIEEGARRAAEVSAGNAIYKSIKSQPSGLASKARALGRTALAVATAGTSKLNPEIEKSAGLAEPSMSVNSQEFVKALTERAGEELASNAPGAVSDAMGKLINSLVRKSEVGQDRRFDADVLNAFDELTGLGVDPAAVSEYVSSLAKLSQEAATTQKQVELAKKANPEASDGMQFTAEDSAAMGAAFQKLAKSNTAFRAMGLHQKASTSADLEKVYGYLKKYAEMGGTEESLAGALAGDKTISQAAAAKGQEAFKEYLPFTPSGSLGQLQKDRTTTKGSIADLQRQLAEAETELAISQAEAPGSDPVRKSLMKQIADLDARIEAMRSKRKKK